METLDAIKSIMHDKLEYISLTDVAKLIKNLNTTTSAIIEDWINEKTTIEFLCAWERIYNSNFNPVKAEQYKTEAGSDGFWISLKEWISNTNATGIIIKSENNEEMVYAHPDIALDFGAFVSPAIKLLIITEYRHLLKNENEM